MSAADKLRSFAESRESPDVVCCGLTYRDIREAHATIADLRDRLRLMAEHMCDECGCAAAAADDTTCDDCYRVGAVAGRRVFHRAYDAKHVGAACISVGLRAICGRRILEGVK